MLAEHMDCPIVNGGDGMHQHPTQALLDLYTMREHLGRLEGLTVGIVGDIAHSPRGRHRSCPALRMVGATPDRRRRRPRCCRRGRDVLGAEVGDTLDDVLPELDVVYMLRIQMERAEGMPFPSLREYARLCGMNAARLARMKPDGDRHAPGPDEPRRRDLLGRGRLARAVDPRPGQRRRRRAHGRHVPAAGR